MKTQKNEDEAGLAGLPTRRLLSRRRALAARLGSAEQVLSGSLTEQTRRCGKAGLVRVLLLFHHKRVCRCRA